jgi:DNA polymerase V
MSVSIIGKGKEWTPSPISGHAIPLFLESVSAGFPSPAQDYVDRVLDLNELCISHPAATFFVRVQGDSMEEAGIYSGDILVVDRSLQPEHNDFVIAGVHGELTVKQLELRPVVRLVPRNSRYSPIEIPDGTDLDVFGVVSSVIRTLRKK